MEEVINKLYKLTAFILSIMLYFRNDIDDHLDSMQTDLESLRELLRSDSYAFDTNTLMGVRTFYLFITKIDFKSNFHKVNFGHNIILVIWFSLKL